jgi:hypothetical protein
MLTLTCIRNEVVHLVEQALKAGKHVMVDDPISPLMSTYHDLIQLAHAQKLQLQETTMFLYHHGLKEFFGYALNKSTFGTIRHVQIELDFPEQNFEHVCNLRSYSTPGDIEPYGCINDLARYSALLGILLFRKTNRKPLSARVIKVNRRNGTCISNCECQIQWEGVSKKNRERYALLLVCCQVSDLFLILLCGFALHFYFT